MVFFGVSTVLPDEHFVGGLGAFIGKFNHDFFGGFGAFYPFILLYPAYKIYKNHHNFSWLLFSQIIGSLLLFFSILLMLAMIKASLGGIIGTLFYDFLRGDIGTLGCILVSLASFFIGFGLCFDVRFDVAIFRAFVEKTKQIKEARQANKIQKIQYTKSAEYQNEIAKTPSQNANPSPSKNTYEKQEKNIDENQDEISIFGDYLNKQSTPNQTQIYKEKLENEMIFGDYIKKAKIARQAEAKSLSIEQKQTNTQEQNTSQNDSFETKPSKEQNELNQNKEQNKAQNEPQTQNDEKQNGAKITAKGVQILSEVAENKQILAQIEKGKQEKPRDFKLPSLEFLTPAPMRAKGVSEDEIDKKIADLLEKLRMFKIEGDVLRTYSGPVVTTFEFKPAASVPVRKILNLQDDLAMALKAQTIRIQAPIPGKDVVGIEIPNKEIETIYLREILESELFTNSKSELTMALGKDIVGAPFITDLKKLPHLLIAGTTGSGKSVGINSMILSLLYRNSPKTLRLVMVDPKILEFSIYNDIPHLLTPVITEPKKAVTVLANLVTEMDRRYMLMAKTHSKNIESYNEKMKATGGESFAFIVVIIDELADLMMTAGKEVEISIARIAQKARASGIHLIIATQRPSVDVVTGLIKANLPSRVSYRVGQKIDSKVILDQLGAESLLGRGDMLFTPPGSPGLVRLHAPFASEGEIEQIVEFLKSQGEANYDESFLKDESGAGGGSSSGAALGELDELYEQAKEVILSEKKTSISYLQRRLTIGYNRAANIIEQLEQNGVLGPANTKGQREIL